MGGGLKFNLVEFLIVAGSLQCILFTVFLLFRFRKINKKENLFLGLFILFFSIIVLNGWYIGSEYYLKKSSLLFLPIYFTLGLGPMFYYYVRHLLSKDYFVKGKEVLHLIPLALQFVYHLINFLKPVPERIDFFQTIHFTKLLPVEEFFGILSLGVYFYISHRYLKAFQISMAKNSNDEKQILFRWVGNFIKAGYLMIFLWMVTAFTDFYFFDYAQSYNYYYHVYIFVILFSYWIMYRGFFDRSKIQSNFNNDITSYSLPQKEVEIHLKKLLFIMQEEQLYLNSKLSLQILADAIDVNPKYLSQIINKELNKNFYDFVNAYRIDMAKKELLSAHNTHLTISAMSSKCGFNSKSVFNNVFKKFTTQTPSQFIKSNSIDSSL